jgi:type III restriction enzyme
MLLRDRKSISLDLATGTGKSFVMYVLAAIALAEGLAERVLVLCPSLPIEDGLLEKFTARAGNGELSGIMQELGAAVSSERRGAPLVQPSRSGLEGVDEVFPAH